MNHKQIYLILAVILVLGAALRFSTLRTGTFSEPDVFVYYASDLQAHGLSLPVNSIYNGMQLPEATGLYYFGLLPSYLFHIPLFTSFMLIASIFALIMIFLTFVFAKQTFNNDKIALLSAFFVATLAGALNYSCSGAYRGDSFIGVFALLSLIFFVQRYKTNKNIFKIIYIALSTLSLCIATAIWSGGAFVIVIYSISVIIISFLKAKKHETRLLNYPLFGSVAWVILLPLFLSINTLSKNPLNETAIILALSAEFISLACFMYGYQIQSKRQKITKALVILGIISIFIIMFFTYLHNINDVIKSHTIGVGYSQHNLNIVEMQKSTITSIISSYGFLAVLSPAIFLSINEFPIVSSLIVTGLFVGLCYLIFSLSKQEGDPKKRLLMMIPLFSYLLITFYLNALEVRFASLAIVPISIFMAFILFQIIDFLKPLQRILVPFIIIITLFTSIVFIAVYAPANNITPQFIHALNWLKNNTPTNSSILAIWPDGSEIEGISNRFVYTDSVMPDPLHQEITVSNWFVTNETIVPFDRKPNYVLLRNAIFNESIPLCEIADINTSYCNKLSNTTFLNQTEPNFYWLWNSCNSLPCHAERGNESYFLQYFENGTKIFLIDYRT